MSGEHHDPPFSQSRLTRALTAIGLPTTGAYELAPRRMVIM